MSPRCFKFNDFELDGARFELRRNGKTLQLERIPLELLLLLTERNGELVARQEIIARLWGKDVFVDTDQGINTAIRKIRAALRDDAEKSRYIQTVSGKGYRFIAELQGANGNATTLIFPSQTTPASPDPAPAQVPHFSRRRPIWTPAGVTAVVLLILGVALALNIGGVRDHIFAPHRTGPIHSIAVLPLANLSGDPSQDYFADGMTDELITALARNRSLRVVSRTSAMQYKGVGKPLRDIAQSLGVDGILEGSVSRSGNRVHVNLQLIYAPTDTHIWAESYDRDAGAAFSLPEELSQTIAAEAKVEPAPATLRRAINPEAHDAYLQGRYFWFKHDFPRSKEYLEKAIQLQPDYAAAWCGLGDAYGAWAVRGAIPPQEGFGKLENAARKALALDDSLPEAHDSMAALYLFNKWDWRQAEAESLRAIELNPNFAEAHFTYAYTLTVLGRNDEALQEQKRSSQISPFERPWGLGFLYLHLRQYDAAITELRLRAEAESGDPFVRSILSEVYWLKGMGKESEQELEKAYVAIGDAKMAEASHRAFERGGERAVQRLGLSTILERARKQYVSPYDIAEQYAYAEDKENTLKFLGAAYHERSPRLIFLQNQPIFDFLHSDGRYRAILKGMGLPLAR